LPPTPLPGEQIHSNFTFRIGINQHGPLFAWYLFMCAYFVISALQICYGYPPFIETNWLTKKVSLTAIKAC
jgi:hypothetical protein